MSTVPDTPEALFAQLSETSLHLFYPEFDSLTTRQQKLIRMLHTELTTGQLNDASFTETLLIVVAVWNRFNNLAQCMVRDELDESEVVTPANIRALEHFSRMEQHHTMLRSSIYNVPTGYDSSGQSPRYAIRGPGDEL